MLQTCKPDEFDNSYNKSEINLIFSMKIVNLKVIQSVLLQHINNKSTYFIRRTQLMLYCKNPASFTCFLFQKAFIKRCTRRKKDKTLQLKLLKYFSFIFYDKYINYKIRYNKHKNRDLLKFRYKIMACDHNYTSYKTTYLLKIVYV
jgi:hypothetical protein